MGRYDPTCIPGFNALAGGTLDAYSLPRVQLPGGRPLGPTRSMAGYVNSPPLLLTTLDGAAWLADRSRYRGESGDAFISSTRVRVRGTVDDRQDAAHAIADHAELLFARIRHHATRTVRDQVESIVLQREVPVFVTRYSPVDEVDLIA